MEFTCLWSKDAQQKKRKRWTDGIARFLPATGVLNVWDQDASMKISSVRLKPDEASAVLQEDGDEVRVGSISLQIMAQQQHRPDVTEEDRSPHQSNHNSAKRAPFATINMGDAENERGDSEKPAAVRTLGTQNIRVPSLPIKGSGAIVSSIGTAAKTTLSSGLSGAKFRRGKLGAGRLLPSAPLASSRSGEVGATTSGIVCDEASAGGGGAAGSAGQLPAVKPTAARTAFGDAGVALTPRAFKPPVSRLTPQRQDSITEGVDIIATSSVPRNSSAHALRASLPSDARQIGGIAAVSKQTGLARIGGGVGGARRFHAPRSSGVPTTYGKVAGATHPRLASGTLSTVSSQQEVHRARGCGGVAPGSAPLTGSGGTVGVSSVANATASGSSGGGGADVVRHDNDLVLEWTAADPRQAVTAGGSLARRLHPHQREGLKILWECLAGRGGYDGRGAILADEMGLGKTATAIALCTCVLRHRRTECRKAVVVCPSSLVKNWANEFRKWCPLGGGAVAVDQAGSAAAQLVADFRIGAPARYPILIISYELYRNHGKIINATEGLGLLIADEGHRMKNSAETKTTRALKACPAVMRLVLTGTPMQNDLDEFFAVADFVNPGLLGTLKSFRSRYTRPIKAAWDRDADETVAELSAERTRELGEVTEKFVLRRTKDVIRGSLPPALEVVIFCRPSARQLSLYERCIASSGAKALLFDDELGGPDPEADKQRRLISLRGVLPLISTLRRLCNHPDLVFESSFGRAGDANDENVEEIFQDVARADGDDLDFFFVDDEDVEVDTSQDSLRDTNVAGATGGVRRGRGEHVLATNTACGKENGAAIATSGCGRGSTGSWKVPRFSGTATGTAAGAGAGTTASNALGLEVDKLATPKYETEASGKVAVLEALLSAVRREYPGDKVVVTSNFTSALDVLGRMAERRGWGFLRLDGGTTSSLRQPLVDRFNRAPPDTVFLFFLSARAGGVGLNLVGANRIVLFDSDWNPATDDQAMARVWRLGQTKEVSMYRLLSTGTLEESIFQRQIFKGALYDLIHDSNESRPSNRSTGDTHNESSVSSRPGGQRLRGSCRDGQGHGRSAGNHDGGKRGRGRGFTQEELKELFVLKAETMSDTYDKLRREQPSTTSPQEIPRQQTARLHPDDDPNSVNEDLADGTESSEAAAENGRGGDGATTKVVTVTEEWNEYHGPSGVLDKALRRALEEAGTPVGGESASSTNTTASSVVTFVHEVRRGGEAAASRENSGCSPLTPRAGTIANNESDGVRENRLGEDEVNDTRATS